MIHYHHTPKFIAHESYTLYPAAFHELHTYDFMSRQNNGIGYDNEAIYAVDSEVIKGEVYRVPVGFIAYELVKWNSSVSIEMAYVKPSYRRQGIHTKMFETLTDRLRDENMNKGANHTYISTSVSANNEASMAAMEKQGRILTSHYYKFFLKDWIKP